MFLGLPDICQFILLNFHIIPIGFLDVSLVEKLLPGITREDFQKYYILPVG